ncbi:MAG: hypothetical protein HYX65_03200 [Gemmatimonadetes bacterium]|nr:hypothetical protein [Gemmatimonadota bacterium]
MLASLAGRIYDDAPQQNAVPLGVSFRMILFLTLLLCVNSSRALPFAFCECDLTRAETSFLVRRDRATDVFVGRVVAVDSVQVALFTPSRWSAALRITWVRESSWKGARADTIQVVGPTNCDVFSLQNWPPLGDRAILFTSAWSAAVPARTLDGAPLDHSFLRRTLGCDYAAVSCELLDTVTAALGQPVRH